MEGCQLCHSLDPRGVFEGHAMYDDQEGLDRESTQTALERSYEDGCRFCGYLLKAQRLARTDEHESFKNDNIRFWSENTYGTIVVSTSRPSLSSYIYSSHKDPTMKNEISPAPISKEAFQFLKRCLDDCLSSHQDKCSDTTKAGRLPTRLLYVPNGSEAIRLVESLELSSISYATLSHCWGQSPPVKLVIASYQTMMSSINEKELPATFKDAIHVAREFGIQYVWIDSLCIIQDDPSDWASESSKMSDIYQNALVTIVAASSPKSTVSFLHKKHNQALVLGESISQDGTLKVRKAFSRGIHTKSGWASAMNRDPTDKRAWTLQERLLSTRMMVFSTEEVQWICNTSRICECSSSWNNNENPFPTLSNISTSSGAYALWHEIVVEYSHRSLTFSKDKLPAISGIATKLSPLTGSGYLAGLWVNNIQRDLCWKAKIVPKNAPIKEPPIKEAYQAPTFSWASINENIEFEEFDAGNPNETQYTIVVGLGSSKPTQDTYGAVSYGYLKLRAPVEPAFLHCSIFHREGIISPSYSISLNSHLGEAISFFKHSNLQSFNCLNSSGSSITTVKRSKSPPVSEWTSRIWLLKLAQVYENFYIMLVLGSSENKAGCFERIGIARLVITTGPNKRDYQEWVRDMRSGTVTIV